MIIERAFALSSFREEKVLRKSVKKKILKFLMHFHPVVVCFSTVVVLPSRVDDER